MGKGEEARQAAPPPPSPGRATGTPALTTGWGRDTTRTERTPPPARPKRRPLLPAGARCHAEGTGGGGEGAAIPLPAHACALGPRAPRPLPPRRRRSTQSPARGRAPAERRHGGARSQPPPARPPAPPPGAAGSAGNLTTNRRKQLTGGPAAAATVRGARADHRSPGWPRRPHSRLFPLLPRPCGVRGGAAHDAAEGPGHGSSSSPSTSPPRPGPRTGTGPKSCGRPAGEGRRTGGAGPGEEVVAAAGRGCSVPALSGGPGRKAGRRWETLTEERTGWGKAGALSRRRAAAGQAGPALTPPPRRRAGAARPGLRRGPRDTVPGPGAAAATSLPSRRRPVPASLGSAGRDTAPRPVTWHRGAAAAAAPCPVSSPRPPQPRRSGSAARLRPLEAPPPPHVNQRCRASAPAASRPAPPPVASRPPPAGRRRVWVALSAAALVGGRPGSGDTSALPHPPSLLCWSLSAAAQSLVPSAPPFCLPGPVPSEALVPGLLSPPGPCMPRDVACPGTELHHAAGPVRV